MILSVSMIVKNEERMLSKILKDCKGFADEIVICDTGSTDSTKDIIRKYNCKLVEFKWNNNFSDARNHCLSHCSGEYIIWLDADDRITKEYQKKILRLKMYYLKKRNDVAYFGNLISDDGGDPQYIEQARIFPKKEDSMWDGRIHETVVNSLFKYQLPLIATDIWIYHEGYVGVEFLEAKIKRNVELLKKDIEETDHPTKKSYLGSTLMQLGRPDEALHVMAPVYDDERIKGAPGQYFTYLMRLYPILGSQKKWEALFGAMEKAKKLFPDDPQPWCAQAESAWYNGKLELAKDLAEEALKREYNPEGGIPVFRDFRKRMSAIIENSNVVLDKIKEAETVKA